VPRARLGTDVHDRHPARLKFEHVRDDFATREVRTLFEATGEVNGYVSTDAFTVYYGTPLPTVVLIKPSQGSTSGGTDVGIGGTYIVPGLVESVHFGTVAATWTTYPTTGVIVATAPPEPAGTVNITVTTTDGTSAPTSADQFTYVAPTPAISGIMPTSGPTAGGTTITVQGTHLTGATKVTFGTSAATTTKVASTGDSLTAKDPAHAAGGVKVSVTTPGGTATSTQTFAYVAPTPPNTTGYRMVAGDGGVFDFGTAQFYGSMGETPLNKPVVASAATPTGNGYWEVAGDGGIFSFGNAQFHGSMGGKPLNKPVVGMAADPATGGYWEVASDGGIFSFDAPFYGSMGGQPLNQPIVGMAADFATGGYWFVSATGGIFSFDAPFHGSATGYAGSPVVGMAPAPTGTGYWIGDATGQVFAEGVPSDGTMTGKPLNQPMVGFAVS